MKPDFSGYVLAGGKSSRMKTDKARLEFGGETFLSRAVKTLSPVCDEKVKVVFNQPQIATEDYECICDIYPERGALGGIHAALKDCQSVWALILAVDLPLVSSETLAILRQIALSSNESSVVVPKQLDGRLQPLCAVYQVKKILPVIEELLMKKSSNALRDFLKLVTIREVETNELTSNQTVDLFFNVNRPADFQSLANPKL